MRWNCCHECAGMRWQAKGSKRQEPRGLRGPKPPRMSGVIVADLTGEVACTDFCLEAPDRPHAGFSRHMRQSSGGGGLACPGRGSVYASGATVPSGCQQYQPSLRSKLSCVTSSCRTVPSSSLTAVTGCVRSPIGMQVSSKDTMHTGPTSSRRLSLRGCTARRGSPCHGMRLWWSLIRTFAAVDRPTLCVSPVQRWSCLTALGMACPSPP